MNSAGSLDPKGRIALVTGANRGLGLEVARALGTRGYSVWLGARDPERGAAAARSLAEAGLNVRFLSLDVADDHSVRLAAERLTTESGRLDVLVNNAGIALDGLTPPSEILLTHVRSTFEINLFGVIRVTQAFLQLLRTSDAGRIVMVSSDLGSHGRQSDPAFPFYQVNPLGYVASKAALNAVTISLAKELRDTAIKVNAANPGFTATDINDHRGVLTVEQGAAPIVALATLPQAGPSGTFLGPEGPEPW